MKIEKLVLLDLLEYLNLEALPQDLKINGENSSIGRALVCGTNGPRFDSGFSPHILNIYF